MSGSDDGQHAGRLPFAAATGAGVRIAVRLTPRAGRNGLDGVAPGPDGRPALRLRVAAPPVEGAANAALVAFVAAALRVRESDVAVVSGERGRLKLLDLSGERGRLKLLDLSGDPAALLARLAEWVEGEKRRRRP
jgi:uncharacterized protein